MAPPPAPDHNRRLMTLFRERLLAKLVEKRAISKELVAKLVAWRHPGFSAHLGDRIAAEDKQRLKDTAAYLVRNPLSLKKFVYLDGQKAVLYRSRMNPSISSSETTCWNTARTHSVRCDVSSPNSDRAGCSTTRFRTGHSASTSTGR